MLRGGYGVFYEAEGTDGRLNFNFIPFRISETVTAAVNAIPRDARGFLAGRAGRHVTRRGDLDSAAARSETRTRSAVESRAFQRQLFSHTAVEVDYVGTTGDHQTAAENINLPPAGPGSVQARRPYPRFGNISLQTQAQSSDYHALQLKVQQRPSKGLWYLVSYTYSNATRRVPAPEIGGNYTYERQPQPWDIRHLLAASYGYVLPFGKGQRWLSDAGPIVNGDRRRMAVPERSSTIEAACPFTPTISRDVANTGVGGQRPNRVGSGAAGESDHRRLVRQERLRRSREFHLRRFGTGHPALG